MSTPGLQRACPDEVSGADSVAFSGSPTDCASLAKIFIAFSGR